jgi:lipid-A-disaccharide synthase
MTADAVLIIAGEKSGETYGAAVVRRFLDRHPETSFFGIGGTNMAEAGVEVLFPMEDLAVIGVFEILGDLPRIGRIFSRLRNEVRLRRPAAALLIDSPDFNLRLAKRLRALGVPVLYYVSPTVWAWRPGRLKKIRKYVAKMCLIFPFEETIYAEAHIPARFVGHPLLERVRATRTRDQFFETHRFDSGKKFVALLPGSRKGEIRFHLPTLVEAVRRLDRLVPAQFGLILAEDLDPSLVEKALPAGGPPIAVLRGEPYEALAAADLALSSCGTANLEAALLGTPLVAFYRLSSLTYAAGKRFVTTPFYSIVNILARERLVPELIQNKFTPDNLVREARALLEEAALRERMKKGFNEIRTRLGTSPASENVAHELAVLMGLDRGYAPP